MVLFLSKGVDGIHTRTVSPVSPVVPRPTIRVEEFSKLSVNW